MGGFPPRSREDRARPVLMLGGVMLLMGVLLFVGRSEGDSGLDSGGPDGARSTLPRGNYQPAPMVPGAPISGPVGGSPISDAPSVTIIQDVRETMQRLPDRQTPRGWGGRPKPQPG